MTSKLYMLLDQLMCELSQLDARIPALSVVATVVHTTRTPSSSSPLVNAISTSPWTTKANVKVTFELHCVIVNNKVMIMTPLEQLSKRHRKTVVFFLQTVVTLRNVVHTRCACWMGTVNRAASVSAVRRKTRRCVRKPWT